jgi:hypothetical protein
VISLAMDQPRLFEFRMGDRSPDKLVVAEANRDAAKLLTDWRMWPGGASAVGPRDLARRTGLAWALEVGAPGFRLPGRKTPPPFSRAKAASYRRRGCRAG